MSGADRAAARGAAASIDIVAMAPGHLQQVLAIEREAFTTPWSEAAFRAELAGGPTARPQVAVPQGEPGVVAGYLVAWVVIDELRIQNVAVAAAWRRRGVGEALLVHALAMGRGLGCRLADLEVRPSNAAALALYRKLGFSQVHRRPRYYADTGEDALVLSLSLSPNDG